MNKNFRSLPLTFKLAEDGTAPTQVQLLRTGMFSYWEKDDLPISSQMLSSMARNFHAKVRKTDLAMDYSHNNHAEAAGWFKDVSVSSDGSELWAEIKWTPEGQKCVKDGEFRYVSAEFSLNYTDDETQAEYGPTLLGAGLTNRPFIKGMQPIVQLSEKIVSTQKENSKMTLEELKALIEGQAKTIATLAEVVNDVSTKLNERLKNEEVQRVQADKSVALAEKTNEFNKLLSEGKVCEAQREAYVAGDSIKFAILQREVKLSNVGSAHAENASVEGDPEEKIIELSKELSKKSGLPFHLAMKQVMRDNKELAEKRAEKMAKQESVTIER